jgi:CRP-like cAMP-binding protein
MFVDSAAAAAAKPTDINDEEDDEVELPPPSFAPNSNRGRRTSVSAESMNPTAATTNYEKIVIPKTAEQAQRIRQSVEKNFLFRQLDDEQYKDVVNAMAEKKFHNGDEVIRQGAVGDYFYIVEVGTLDVFVAKAGGKESVKVASYGPGGSFGELALMYNAPRAATVKATSDCVLWALDRVTFRRILMETTSKKRRMYEEFLEKIPLLASLEAYERHKIADALEPAQFQDGQVVIKQGEMGNSFYIIESGEAKVFQKDDSGTERELEKKYVPGDYFGELALLSNRPRAATIIASGKLRCATLGKEAFDRLLGPVLDIVKRNTAQYKELTRRKSIKGKIYLK